MTEASMEAPAVADGLVDLGERLLERYRSIFRTLYQADRNLTIRRDSWGFALGLFGTAALYGAYAWVAVTTVSGRLAAQRPGARAGNPRGPDAGGDC